MEVELKLENCNKKKIEMCLWLYIQFVRKNWQTFRRRVLTWQLGYQNTVIFRLGSEKNGETFWVLSKIRKTVPKLYFRKNCYVWEMTGAFFESITLMMAQEKIIIIFAG